MTHHVAIGAASSRLQSRALVAAYRRALAVEPAPRPGPARRPLSKFPRLSLGQAFRAALLLLVCFGFAQFSHADGARPDTARVAVESARR